VRTGAAATSRGLPWSRARTVRRVEDGLARLAPDDPDRAELAVRARSYARDCGCAMSGVFLGAALLLTIAFFAATRSVDLRSLTAAVLFVFVATLLGKLLGLLLAWVRLVALARSLTRRSSSVYVH
jgi:hypothetical protein